MPEQWGKINANRFLKPYQSPVRRRRKIAGDIETFGLFGEYALGALFDGETVTYHDTPEGMVDAMLARKNAGSVFLFHNGFNYDMKYLIEPLARRVGGPVKQIVPLVLKNNRLVSLRIRTRDKRVYTVWDTTNLIKRSLADVTAKFAPDYGKKEFDHEATGFDPDDLEHREYLKYDVLGLYHAIENLEALLIEHFNVSLSATMSGVATRAFRRTLTRPYLRLANGADKFFRKSIHGGLTYLRDTLAHQDMIQLDVNAMYGHVMKGEYPIGSPIRSFYYRTDLLGCWRCEVHCWEHVKRPFLCNSEGVRRGVFEAYLWSETIEFARARGYVIIPLEGLYFERTEAVYREFIAGCEALELANKGNPVGDMVKLIRNSVYGTSVMQKDRMEYCISEDIPGPGWNETINVDSVAYEYVPCLWQRAYILESENMMPHWGSLTLARARMEAVKLVEDCNGIYSDTDCVVCSRADYEAALAAGKLSLGTAYGQLKIDGEFAYFRVTSPKEYTAILPDGAIKKRHKGIPHKAVSGETAAEMLRSEQRMEMEVEFLQSNSLMSMIKRKSPRAEAAKRTYTTGLHSMTYEQLGNGRVEPVWVDEDVKEPERRARKSVL